MTAKKRRRAKVIVGKDAEGKSIIKYASGKTKKELEENKAELLKKYVLGDEAIQRDILFEVYAREWYETYKKPNISFSSRQSYATIMNVHLFPTLAGRQLRAITANDLQELMNAKAGCCVAIIGYAHSILTNIFQSAYARGLIDRDPTVGLKKPPAVKKTKRALTDDEVAAALRVGHEDPNGLLILLLYYTGARLGEACGFQWQDVDFKKKMISVRRDIDFKTGEVGTVKTKHSIRDIPLPEDLIAALLPIRGVGNAFILTGADGNHWRNSQLNRMWKSLMAKMHEIDPSIESRGEPPASVLTAHYFRHNYASILYNADVDILSAQRFLGHSSVKTTLEIYSHLSAEKEDMNADKARDAFVQKVAKKLPAAENCKPIDK